MRRNQMELCFCSEGKTGTCVYCVSLQVNSLCTYYYICMSVFVSNPGFYCFSLETYSYIFSVTTQANNGLPHKDSHSPHTSPLSHSFLLNPSPKNPPQTSKLGRIKWVIINNRFKFYFFLGIWMKAIKGLAKNHVRAWSLLSLHCHFCFHYWASSRTVEPAKCSFSPMCWAQ